MISRKPANLAETTLNQLENKEKLEYKFLPSSLIKQVIFFFEKTKMVIKSYTIENKSNRKINE